MSLKCGRLRVRGQKVGGLQVFTDPRLPELGQRMIVKKGERQTASSEFSVYDHYRLSLGVADGSKDMIVEKSTLTDGNFDLLNGVSYTKGCYVWAGTHGADALPGAGQKADVSGEDRRVCACIWHSA